MARKAKYVQPRPRNPIRLHDAHREHPLSRRMCAELARALDREQTHELIRLQVLRTRVSEPIPSGANLDRTTLTAIRAYCTGQDFATIAALTGKTEGAMRRLLTRMQKRWGVAGQLALARAAIRRGVITATEFLDGTWAL